MFCCWKTTSVSGKHLPGLWKMIGVNFGQVDWWKWNRKSYSYRSNVYISMDSFVWYSFIHKSFGQIHTNRKKTRLIRHLWIAWISKFGYDDFFRLNSTVNMSLIEIKNGLQSKSNNCCFFFLIYSIECESNRTA